MNCRKARKLIVTDYLDEEINLSLRKAIDLHLDGCAGCRALKQKVLILRGPLKDSLDSKVPDSVWDNIAERIINKEISGNRSFISRLLDKSSFNFLPKPVLTASAFVLILAVLFGSLMLKESLNSSLNGGLFISEYYSLEDSADFSLGTKIEEYFL